MEVFKEDKSTSQGLLRQYIAAFIVSLSVMTAGSAYTWIEPLMHRLQQPGAWVVLTEAQISWVASVIEIGPLVTPLPVGFLVNRLGRKPLLLLTGPLYIISWILVLTTSSYEVLILVRTLQGMGIGIIMTTIPLYLGEIADPKVRGSVGTFVQCMWYLGVLYVYSVGPFTDYQLLTWLCMLPQVVFVLGFFWFPETPYCLVMKGKESDAMKSLAWFRGKEVNADDEEMKTIQDSVAEENKNNATWRDLVNTSQGRKSMMIVIVVGLATYMSGLRTVQAYASSTFYKTTNDQYHADMVTIVMGALTLVATMMSSFLVDNWGRRPLLLTSTVGSFIVLGLAAVYFYFALEAQVAMPSLSWTPYITITLYSVLMSLSSSIGFTLQAELFPSNTRGIASGATTLSTTLMCFASLKLYHSITDTIGLYFNYIVFSAFAGLGSLFIYRYMPETKEKSFAEIQQMIAT